MSSNDETKNYNATSAVGQSVEELQAIFDAAYAGFDPSGDYDIVMAGVVKPYYGM